MNSGLERELTPCVKEWVGPGRGQGEDCVMENKSRNVCVGSRMGLRGIF